MNTELTKIEEDTMYDKDMDDLMNEYMFGCSFQRVQVESPDTKIFEELDNTIATETPSSIESMSCRIIHQGKIVLKELLCSTRECVYKEIGSEGSGYITYGLYKAKNKQVYLTRYSFGGLQKDMLTYTPVEQSVLAQSDNSGERM